MTGSFPSRLRPLTRPVSTSAQDIASPGATLQDGLLRRPTPISDWKDSQTSSSPTVNHRSLPALKRPEKLRPDRLLVYDLETYATGFADPAWVPQVVTCISWKWLHEGEAQVRASIDYAKPRRMPHLQREAIKKMILPFLRELEKADAVVTYNGQRFDHPILNGTMYYIGLRPLEPILNYDLHDFGKVKGVKKGLDNTATHLGATEAKLSLNHAQWTEGYLEPGWPTVKERAKSDVELTEEVYDLKKKAGWLRPARKWQP